MRHPVAYFRCTQLELFCCLYLVFKITWVNIFVKLFVISIHMEKYVKHTDDDTWR